MSKSQDPGYHCCPTWSLPQRYQALAFLPVSGALTEHYSLLFRVVLSCSRSCPVAPGAYCPQCTVGHRHGAPWVDLQDVTHQPDTPLCPGYLSLTTPSRCRCPCHGIRQATTDLSKPHPKEGHQDLLLDHPACPHSLPGGHTVPGRWLRKQGSSASELSGTEVKHLTPWRF